MTFVTVRDAWEAFQRMFGSEPCPWTEEQFRAYRFERGTRYEDIDDEWMSEAWDAANAENSP